MRFYAKKYAIGKKPERTAGIRIPCFSGSAREGVARSFDFCILGVATMREQHSPAFGSDPFEPPAGGAGHVGEHLRISGPPPAKGGSAAGLLAPHIKGCLLGPKMFNMIECFEVCSAGFWYLAEAPQNRQSVVISVRRGTDFVHALADVVGCSPIETAGVEAFRIECRFRGDLPSRQVQILRQLWLLETSRVAGCPDESPQFSYEEIF